MKDSKVFKSYQAHCFHCGWSLDFPNSLDALNRILNYEKCLVKNEILFSPECKPKVRGSLYAKVFGYGLTQVARTSIAVLIMIITVILSKRNGLIWITILNVIIGLILII